MADKLKVDKVLDVKGFLCPMTTVMTGKTIKEMEIGQSLQVITNDMTTKKTIPELCNQGGHDILEVKEKDGLICFIIRK